MLTVAISDLYENGITRLCSILADGADGSEMDGKIVRAVTEKLRAAMPSGGQGQGSFTAFITLLENEHVRLCEILKAGAEAGNFSLKFDTKVVEYVVGKIRSCLAEEADAAITGVVLVPAKGMASALLDPLHPSFPHARPPMVARAFLANPIEVVTYSQFGVKIKNTVSYSSPWIPTASPLDGRLTDTQAFSLLGGAPVEVRMAYNANHGRDIRTETGLALGWKGVPHAEGLARLGPENLRDLAVDPSNRSLETFRRLVRAARMNPCPTLGTFIFVDDRGNPAA